MLLAASAYPSGFWAVPAALFLLCTTVNAALCLLGRLPKADCSPAPPQEPAAPIGGATVLICARNEAHHLPHHLPQVLAQICSFPFEVLVVDDASTDHTAQLLREMSAQHPHLTTLHIQHKAHGGKKQALTLGTAAARYDTIVLTDADCQPQSEHWLQHMADTLRRHKDTEIVLGYGGYRTAGPHSLLHQWVQFETIHTAWAYFSCATWGMPYMGVGRNLAWTKQLFNQTNGMQAHWSLRSGDDDLFVNAAATPRNVALNLCPDAFTWSAPKHSWQAWWQQKQRHLQAGSHYRPLHRLLLGTMAFTQSAHYGGLALLSLSTWAGEAWALWALRMLLVLWAWRAPLQVFEGKTLLPFVPLFDAGLAAYWAAAAGHLAFKSESQQHRW